MTSGENYEFKNEDNATIFQSYEFKLWDLKNNTEYEIPDGQYVSVTIPVKEGYKYSIEHLLDNGATETIIPSVNGSTMVFSTHSFSPFGIAGFRPIVGEDIANGAYGDGSTPTPTPAVTISGTPTPSPSVTGAGTNGTNGSGTVKRIAIAEMKLVEIQVIQMESAMEIQMALPMGLEEPEMVVLHLVPEALTAVTIPNQQYTRCGI